MFRKRHHTAKISSEKNKHIQPNIPVITVLQYSKNSATEKTGTTLNECLNTINPTDVTWVNVEGLQPALVQEVGQRFTLHPLTIEDILNLEQRPKIEEFENYIYISLKVLLWQAKEQKFLTQQLSLVVGDHYVLTLHELDTHLFDTIRKHLQLKSANRTKEISSGYLVYRLLDAIVDEYFIVLDAIGDEIEIVEEKIIHHPKPQNARTIYRLKREMLYIRKVIWPVREITGHLLHVQSKWISNFTQVYLRDVYDHVVQAIDTFETFRDMLSSMLDMYLSTLTNRLNEIMKTLTIITTIFIPITSLASIYGMNFPDMPGIHWRYGYPLVISMMVIIAIVMLIYFKRRKWL